MKPALLEKLQEAGITEPTAVQQEAIPVLLEGKDAVVLSQTGTGKTLAYVLPLLEKIDPGLKKLQALILVPTRELGTQVAAVLEQFTSDSEIVSQSIIGGAAIGRQMERLRLHPQIIVGTPGRIYELIKLKKLSMHFVKTIVLDEADHMLEMGETVELEGVLHSALRDKQLCFFSATMPESVLALGERWMKEPVRIEPNAGRKAAETLEHLYLVCEERERIDVLRKLVRAVKPQSGIVFINQVDRIGEVLAKLQYAGLSIEALYSEAGKQERAKVMKEFREGGIQLLLATDVAARGLDIPEVTHVIHFELPVDADHYVHRSGRTGRMGRQGIVISLCAYNQTFIMEKYEKALGIEINRVELYEGRLVRPADKAPAPGAPFRGAARNGQGGNGGGKRASAPSLGTSGKPKAPSVAKAPPVKKSKAQTEKERKNKGAPKWLKAKQNGSGEQQKQ